MPTTYAHYKFGEEVMSALPRPLQNSIENKRELFDIGLHGPDILFYYRPILKNKVTSQGYAMHDRPADEFFNRAAEVIRLRRELISMVLSATSHWTASVIPMWRR